MTPGILRKDITGILSFAKHLQDLHDRRGLELAVSQNLPTEFSGEIEIPDEAMYDLAETLRIDKRYMEQSLNLHSNSESEVLGTLNSMGVLPSKNLKKRWLNNFAERYSVLVQNILDISSLEVPPLKIEKFTDIFETLFFSSLVHYTEKRRLSKKKIYVGDIKIWNLDFEEETIPVKVQTMAYTPEFLTLCSGPIKEMTSTITKVREYSVIYAPII